MCVCGNPKAFTHLFILFLLPLHPRIISFPTVYRNRHNYCTFLPSEKRQPPLRLQFSSVTRKNTYNPPSICFIPLLDANSPKALTPEVLGFILRFLPPSKSAFPGCFSPYLDSCPAQSRRACPCAAGGSVQCPQQHTLLHSPGRTAHIHRACCHGILAHSVFDSWFAGLCFHFDIRVSLSKVHSALQHHLSSYHLIVICRQLNIPSLPQNTSLNQLLSSCLHKVPLFLLYRDFTFIWRKKICSVLSLRSS